MRTLPARSLVTSLLAACLAAFVILGAGSTAHAKKMTSKEWKAAQELFENLFGSRGNPSARVELMKKFAGDGSARALKFMAEGLHKEVQLVAQIQAEIAPASEEHSEILNRSRKGYTRNDAERVQGLQAQLAKLDGEAKAEHRALAGMLELCALGSKDLRRHILKRTKDGEWAYRAAALRVAVATLNEKPSWAHLKKAIAKDDDPRVRIAGLDALAQAPEHREDLVLDRLADPDEMVVSTAARILEQRGSPQAIQPLIEAMAGASPRVAYALRRALHALTKDGAGSEAEAWTKWKAEHKDDVAYPWMCGVPLASRRVLFVIDVSGGTMKEPENAEAGKPWKSEPPGVAGDAPPHKRLAGLGVDIAKHELKKAITRLPASTTFNIIAFKQSAIHWQRTMMYATERNKEQAYAWLRGVKPHGVSYVDGALRMAFRLAGLLDAGTGPLELAADTIVFISVGVTTDNALPQAAAMEPEIVLDHVRTWNRQKLMVIHCVGIDSSEYMKKLAAENGGVYVE